MNTEKAKVSPLYLQLIEGMHQDKLKINDAKLARHGSIDIDDHGFIDFPEFTFEPETCEDGLVHGCACIGRNFRRFLNEMPKYINPNSALACCWVGTFDRFAPLQIADADRPHELDETIQKYRITQAGFGGMNHLCPDMEIGLREGWKGLLEKIRYYRKKNNPPDPDFYEGEEQMVLGILEWVKAHQIYAEELAAKESDPFLRDNYLAIAKVNGELWEHEPRTFREAVQFLAHFQAVDRTFYAGGALGALDTLLEEYFERDIESGILTEEEAVWMIASLFFNDTHYTQIGGLTPAGDREVTSRLSFLILDAMHLLKIPTNLGIRVHAPIAGQGPEPEILLKRAVEYTIEDGYGVCYSLEKGISEGFSKNGFPLELGRMRVKCGCNWVAIPGREYPLQDVTRVNMAVALHYGLKDLQAQETRDLDLLWERFTYHLQAMVECVKAGYDKHYEVMQRNRPEIVLNLFMHGPIERGLNCSNGGVDILDLNIDGIALATVADSFAAIEQRVVEEKKLTWDRLFELLDTNYEGAERTPDAQKHPPFRFSRLPRPGLGSTHPGLLCSIVQGLSDQEASSDDRSRTVLPRRCVCLWKDAGGNAQRPLCRRCDFPFFRTGPRLCKRCGYLFAGFKGKCGSTDTGGLRQLCSAASGYRHRTDSAFRRCRCPCCADPCT